MGTSMRRLFLPTRNVNVFVVCLLVATFGWTRGRRSVFFPSAPLRMVRRADVNVDVDVNESMNSDREKLTGRLSLPMRCRRNKAKASIGNVSNVVDLAKGQARSSSSSTLWPPFPFNLISPSRPNAMMESESESSISEKNGEEKLVPFVLSRKSTRLFVRYISEKAKLGIYCLQHVASDISYHLPPASLPLVGLATMGGNARAQTLARVSLGVALLSWASHSGVDRSKRLTALPLSMVTSELPPFLPPPVEDVDDDEEEEEAVLSPEVVAFSSLHDAKIKARAVLKEWNRTRRGRTRDHAQRHRQRIYDDLTERVRTTNRSKVRSKRGLSGISSSSSVVDGNDDGMGYALVTGASRGLGRALAVELARYGVPLLLVSRDVERLEGLASDIRSCYGVDCTVVGADLSSSSKTVERLHDATEAAGFRVDLLVLNAGICWPGRLVDAPVRVLETLLGLNTVSTTLLCQRYGADMVRRGRGRILMVSSVTGAIPAGPGVAAYAASKAYLKSLSLSLGRELERDGVGVTCLLPGGIADTTIHTAEGAIYKRLPGYVRPPEEVASKGVRALLAGDAEVTPGWPNRLLVRVVQPLLPQRLTTLVVEAAFRPLGGWSRSRSRSRSKTTPQDATASISDTAPSRRKGPLPSVLPLEIPVEQPDETTEHQPTPTLQPLDETETKMEEPKDPLEEPTHEVAGDEPQPKVNDTENPVNPTTSPERKHKSSGRKPLQSHSREKDLSKSIGQ